MIYFTMKTNEIIERLETIEEMYCKAEERGAKYTPLERQTITAIQDLLDDLCEVETNLENCILN